MITIEDQSVEAVSSVRQKGYVRWEAHATATFARSFMQCQLGR